MPRFSLFSSVALAVFLAAGLRAAAFLAAGFFAVVFFAAVFFAAGLAAFFAGAFAARFVAGLTAIAYFSLKDERISEPPNRRTVPVRQLVSHTALLLKL